MRTRLRGGWQDQPRWTWELLGRRDCLVNAGSCFKKSDLGERKAERESIRFRRKIRRGVRVGSLAFIGGLLSLRLLFLHLFGIAGDGFGGRVPFASGVERKGGDGGEEGEGLEFHGSKSSRAADWLRLRAEALRSVRRARIVWPPLPTILGMSEGLAAIWKTIRPGV